ncbi:MAG TPA: glutathione S-transferase N-terminal domain-containing protein [Caulobacteraceae bacterium]|jgi:GST-like protein|nr:glutathione S-transferase N-terminal domain-containing protein [Caulobacteraceae bacterium]
MIVLYTWTTPNGRKVPILLEELGLPYEVRTVNIGKDEQFAPAFLAVAPNNKIPAIVDPDGPGGPLSLFESGAILTYLADKHGQFLPGSGAERWKVQEWLHWQIGGLGPMLGQFGFFAKRSPVRNPGATERFHHEMERLFGVMDRRLGEVEYLGGDYSIADIACYPWMTVATGFLAEFLTESLSTKPNIHRWMAAVAARPAVQRGMLVPKV